jgi:hypothetical protein
VSVGFFKDDAAIVTGNHHRTGEFFGGDPELDNPIDLLKPGLVRCSQRHGRGEQD